MLVFFRISGPTVAADSRQQQNKHKPTQHDTAPDYIPHRCLLGLCVAALCSSYYCDGEIRSSKKNTLHEKRTRKK